MAQFSQANATATCASLSVTAQSTTAKIQELLATRVVAEDALQKQLAVLAARLRTFRQHAVQLGRCVADTPAVHQQLGDVLKSALSECQTALESVPGRLAPGCGGLTADAITCYETLVMAYVRLWALATQLLIIETDQEQQSKLASPASQLIVDAAHKASEGVLSFNYATEN